MPSGILVPGGAFVGKIFQGEDFPAAQAAVRALFATSRVSRPEATRDVSYEVFLVGQGAKVTIEPPTEPGPEAPAEPPAEPPTDAP